MRLPPALVRPLRRVEARLRFQRALDAGTLLVVPSGALVVAIVGAMKLGHVTPDDARAWVLCAVALPVVGFIAGSLRRVPRLLPADLLDRAHDLKSRLANALEFAGLPDAERTAFMSAAVEDATARAAALKPSAALPIRPPRDLFAALGFTALALLVHAVEVPVEHRLPPPSLP
ncbi:MAG: hypothetical protein H5U40_03290, partial [Polyangiaceae bacterium]|nr:hypothetical protein [Polyangiaceae bacterium]